MTDERDVSIAYYLPSTTGKVRVCKPSFLCTLCTSNRSLLTAIFGKTTSGVFGGQDGREKKSSVNKTTDEQTAFVNQHTESFPKTESHHCHKDTQNDNISTVHLTYKKMYTSRKLQ